MDKYITIKEYQEMFHAKNRLNFPDGERGGIKLFKATAEVVDELQTWTVREDDVWIVTYMKAGTTWAQEIASCVMHDGDLDTVKQRHAVFRVPFLEHDLPEEFRRKKNLPKTHKVLDESPSPRMIKTHLPGHLLPPQIWVKKPKIIYVIRNPKDLVVSCFHFAKLCRPIDRVAQVQQFEEFSREMMEGSTHYGPWWDHYLYFWKRRHDDNILILRFEDMKRDLRGNVEKISRFLGKILSDTTMDAITAHCSFISMKNNRMSNHDILFENTDQQHMASFMRKGIVGDWKSHFTVAHNETMDAFIQEKLRGTGLTFDYN